jgi:hypothetical protein
MREVSSATSRVFRAAVAACLALVLSMGATESVPAQTTTLKAGAWVRFATDDGTRHHVGRVVSVTADSITLQYGEPWMSQRQVAEYAPTTLPMRQVGDIEVQIARHAHTGEGLALGLTAGVLAGAAIGSKATSSCSGDSWAALACPTPASSATAVLVAIPFGALGAFVGAIVGGSFGTEVWTSVDSKTATRLEVMPRKGGVAARLSFSLR